jgi:hypothetical protein
MPATQKQTIPEPRGTRTQDAEIAVNEESMAANPAFEADAILFEKKLGALAYGHDQSNDVVKTASERILTYIDERSGGADKIDKVNEALTLCGSDNKTYSGIVGLEAAKIRKVFEAGKLGERCNHIEAFYQKVLVPDLIAAPTNIDEMLQKADFAVTNLKKRAKGATNAHGTYEKHAEGTTLGDQWRTRQKRTDSKAQGLDRDIASPTLGQVEQEGPTVDNVQQPGVKLSDDEKTAQGVSQADDSLSWINGQATWVMNEANKWVQAQRALSLPLVAGPSGTTDRLMQTFGGLNVGKPSTRRLACIGYLLPANHHSLVEILTGAAPHGIGFTESQKMYMNIAPLSVEELKACGDGKYPHQRHKKDTPVTPVTDPT